MSKIYKGYVGIESKKRSRKKVYFLIAFVLISFFIYLSISGMDTKVPTEKKIVLEVPTEDIIKIEESVVFEDQSLKIKEQELKIIEYKQKIDLQDKLILSFKEQLASLEKSNAELIASIKIQNKENKKSNINSTNLKQIIKELKKETKQQNDKLLLFKEENKKLNNKIIIFNNDINSLNQNINKLVLQKKELSIQLQNLNKDIIEKNKIIDNLKDKIHH